MKHSDHKFAGPNYLVPMILIPSVLVPSVLVPSEDRGGTGDHVMSIFGLIRADRLAEPCSEPSIMLRAVV